MTDLPVSPRVTEQCVECIARDYKIAALQESIGGCAQKVAELAARLRAPRITEGIGQLIAKWRELATMIDPNDIDQSCIEVYEKCADELEAALVTPRATEPVDEPPLLHESKALNPWQPERDTLRLAVLGKLGEELGEASSATLRCIIQGIDESEPVTGKPNRQWLQDEIADVYATATMAVELFGLSSTDIARRMERKIQHLRAWHGLLASCAAHDKDQK